MTSPFVGVWSFFDAIEGPTARDTKLVLRADGSGKVIAPGEEFPITWSSPTDSELMFSAFGNSYGPFSVSICE